MMNKKYLGWLAMVIAIIVGAGIKTASESDADKKASRDAIAAKIDKLTLRLDKTGMLAQVDALGAFFTYCKANVGPTDPGVTLSEDEKTSFCGCAGLGMQKLYYRNLSVDELIERANWPPPKDIGPADIRRQVFSACSDSLDIYKSP